MWLRCALLSFLDKWWCSTVSLRYVLGLHFDRYEGVNSGMSECDNMFIKSFSWLACVSVATAMISCSGLSSFCWHHGFSNFSSSVCVMPAHLITRSPCVLQWTYIGFLFRQGLRHSGRVPIDLSMSFPIFPLLCLQRTFVVSCVLLLAIEVSMVSQPNDRFCHFWHHFSWESAFWDEHRKLRPGVLTSVLSYVWWVPHAIVLLHRSVLGLFQLADFPECTLFFLM